MKAFKVPVAEIICLDHKDVISTSDCRCVDCTVCPTGKNDCACYDFTHSYSPTNE